MQRNPRLTGLAQTTCLRDEIIEYRHGVFDAKATEAVDRPFRAVIEQLQPKQRRAAKIDLRSPKHADFAVPNRGERNRRFWTILRNRGEFDESSRNSQFGKRAFGRVAACQTTNPKMRCEVHNRAAANGAARLFTFDKPEAASADGYSKTGQNALVKTRPIICCFAPASRAPSGRAANR